MNKFVLIFILLFACKAFAKERIVSASAFATEILFELNLQDEIVGVDLTSVHPPQARKIPQIGYKRSLTSEGILFLKPTIVITDSSSGPASTIEAIRKAGIQVIQIKEPKNIEDIKSEVLVIGKNFKKESFSIVKKIDDLSFKIKTHHSGTNPTIAFISRHGGIEEFASGKNTIQDKVISLVGGVNSINFTGTKPMNAEIMASLKTDYIIYSTFNKLSDTEKAKIRNEIGFSGKRIIFVQSIPLLSFGIASLEDILEISKQIK